MVEVDLKGTPPDDICGLMILTTDKNVVVWRARNGNGEMVVLPLEGIERLSVGALRDIMQVAQAGARKLQGSIPTCESALNTPATAQGN